MASTSMMFIPSMTKSTLLGLPANLRRYSRVNQEMQTDSIRASFGLSRGFPNMAVVSRLKYSKRWRNLEGRCVGRRALCSSTSPLWRSPQTSCWGNCWLLWQIISSGKYPLCICLIINNSPKKPDKSLETWYKTSTLLPGMCRVSQSGPRGISDVVPTFNEYKIFPTHGFMLWIWLW